MATLLNRVLSESVNPNSIKIKNREETEKKLNAIHAKGPVCLQVITDFDMTLTRYHHKGVRCHSTYGVLDHSPLMPNEYKTKAHDLTAKYYPIEIDHSLTIEEKVPHMEVWYREGNASLMSFGIHKALFKAMVADSRALLRDNAQKMLKMLWEAEVPVLIFSAGLGNILVEVLDKYDVHYPNVSVISNFMDFDKEEKAVGFKQPVIHMYNKNQSALVNTTQFLHSSCKHNVILLGDSLGDVQMSEGVPNLETVLKIGFLNVKIEESLDSFMENFDIVLIDDQSMDFVNGLLKYLL